MLACVTLPLLLLQFKISQYADDATCFLKSESSLCHLLQVVRRFEIASGAKLNTTKTENMWLGRWRANGASPFGLKWVSKIRILGVFFSNGLVSVESDNWKAKLDKLENVLNLWRQRELSFVGHTMIINVLGASRFWHVAKILAPPRWVCHRYKRFVWPFIWKGKMENVSRQRCCAPLSSSGLGVVDFQTKCASLRLSCFLSLRDDFGSDKWQFLARFCLGNCLFKFDPRFSFASNSVPSSSDPSLCYRQCLALFQSLFERHGSVPDDLSCKNIYSLLSVFPSSAPTCAGFWGAVVGRPIIRWVSVWRKSRLKITKIINVMFFGSSYIMWFECGITSRFGVILPPTVVLFVPVLSPPCHCFVECCRVIRVWNFFSPFLSRLLGSPFVLSFSSVLFPLSPFSSSPEHRLSSYLIAIVYFVWLARNLATFRNSSLGSHSIINMIIKDIKLRILGEPVSRVKDFWSAGSVICSVDCNGRPIFHF